MECGEILQPISVIECLGIAIIGVKLSIASFSSPKYGVERSPKQRDFSYNFGPTNLFRHRTFTDYY